MATDLNFDATTVDPSSPLDPVPSGWYRAHIVASELKPTKDQKGAYLQLEFDVLDGEYKGRKFWDRLNLKNENATAVEIAQRALSALCHAAGQLRVKNSQQLHHIPVMVKVKVKEDKGFEPGNEVKGYKAVEGGPGIPAPLHGNTALGGSVAAGVTQTAGAPSSPPWANKKAG